VLVDPEKNAGMVFFPDRLFPELSGGRVQNGAAKSGVFNLKTNLIFFKAYKLS